MQLDELVQDTDFGGVCVTEVDHIEPVRIAKRPGLVAAQSVMSLQDTPDTGSWKTFTEEAALSGPAARADWSANVHAAAARDTAHRAAARMDRLLR
jgi:hypothetical protein